MANNKQQQLAAQKDVWGDAVRKAKARFEALVKSSGLDVNYGAEALYATQALMGSDYLSRIASENPASLQMALVNVAAVGLTLNPARGLAALVPRDGAIRLDIMYRGLVHIAVETGSILWAKAELVYNKDKYVHNGPCAIPTHVFDPFGPRGEVIGGYCLAKMPDKEFLVETMAEAEFLKVRNASSAWKNGAVGKKGPWEAWPDEMRKKTLVKRASKTWPAKTPRLAEAMQILNEDNGEGLAVLDGQAAVVDESIENSVESGDATQASAEARAYIDKTVKRAAKVGAWATARDYLASRFNGDNLAYARKTLDAAEAKAKGAQEAASSNEAAVDEPPMDEGPDGEDIAAGGP
jgi:recombination protein RecT